MRRLLAGALLALLAGSTGCDSAGPTFPLPTSPTTATTSPAPAPAPTPTPTGPMAVALFGTVFERTADGLQPLEGVLLYCDACGQFGHTFLTTDANGRYRFPGDLAQGGGVWVSDPVAVLVQKIGYTVVGGVSMQSTSYPDGYWVTVTMHGDTEFNIVLVSR